MRTVAVPRGSGLQRRLATPRCPALALRGRLQALGGARTRGDGGASMRLRHVARSQGSDGRRSEDLVGVRYPLRGPAMATRGQPLQAAATSGAAPAKPPSVAPVAGIKPIPMALAIGVGLLINYVVPCPADITPAAWKMFSVFSTTIAGLVLEPLPVGAWAFSCLTFTVVSKTLPFAAAFAAFTSDVIWLIVISFFFALGFDKTGLGERVAVLFVRLFGGSSLGLGYGLACSELVLSPAIPSTTARAGGIFMPVIKSLSKSAGSLPGETANKLGKFLAHSQLHASCGTSALFLTGAAQNLLCLKLASQMGIEVPNAFVNWFLAALLPGLAVTFMSPILTYWLVPPTIKETPEAPAEAAKKLEEMGPLSKDETVMMATMAGAITLWILGDKIGISSPATAMLGLTALLATGVLKWKDCLQCSTAWDTLVWFSVLVGMSAQLNHMGIIASFQNSASALIAQANMSWPVACTTVCGLYFLVHYFFASQTAHTGALMPAALATMVAAGTPGMISVLLLAYITNLFGGLNHYASGQAAVYYASGYVTLGEMMKVGLIQSVIKFIVWGALSVVGLKLFGFV